MARILLVEDDADVRFMLEHVLVDGGYAVDSTDTASGANELLQCRRYDLVLTDAKLPDGTGMDVADAAVDRGMKAILMTGYAFTLPRAARKYEMLLKPLRSVEIVTAIQRALHSD
jgi:two-component system response regulator HydG